MKKSTEDDYKTFKEAKNDWDLLIYMLESGDLKGDPKCNRRIARRMKKCRKSTPCRVADCPRCAFRRQRARAKIRAVAFSTTRPITPGSAPPMVQQGKSPVVAELHPRCPIDPTDTPRAVEPVASTDDQNACFDALKFGWADNQRLRDLWSEAPDVVRDAFIHKVLRGQL